MQYVGNIVEDETVNVFFTTNDSNGAAVAPSTAFEAADIAIYKDNSATQKTTTNGLTMTSPFDAVVGLHLITIDTSNDTGDAGFWVTGSDYTVILNPDETVDGQTIVSVLAQFSIQNKYMRGTDSAALASVATEARLAELDAANIPADVDAILTDTAEIGAAGAGLTAIDLPDQTMNITGNITGNLSGSVGSVTGNINTAAGTIQTLDALDTAQDTQHGITQAAISGLNDPTAAAIADQVWDEAKAGHVAAGSFGEEVQAHALSSEVSALNDLSAAEVNAEADTALSDFFTSSAQLVDDVWDEVITGAAHNVNNSAAKFLREASEATGVTGTATAGGATSITLAVGESATNNIYAFERVRIIEGTGAGQSRLITAYDGTTKVATVNRAWSVNPSTDSVYVISSADATVEAVVDQLASATATVDFDDLATILVDTNELQADWTDGGRLDLIADAILADTNELQTDNIPGLIAALNDITVADILAATIETGYDVQAVLRLIGAACAGKLSGAATVTNTIRSLDDSVDRITATVDASGNRSAVTHNI